MSKKLTINEVAERYGVSTKTVRRYISGGVLTAHRLGPRLIRLDAAEVEAELFGNKVGGPTDS